MPYEAHQAVAERAVRAAAYLTSSVFDHLGASDKLDKSDASPVTVGDFGSQAIIISLLAQAFPDIPVVGEEDATALRGDAPDAKQLREHVTSLARQSLSLASLHDPATNADLPEAQKVAKAVSSKKFADDEFLDAIDRGNYEGGPKGSMWVLDPIDGTKGFLRGGQYAICLALVVDGQIQVGVIGSPNLPIKSGDDSGPKGLLVSAIRGQGAIQTELFAPAASQRIPIHFAPLTPSDLQAGKARFCESVEAGHASHGTNERIAQLLNLDTAHSVRMDSQAKYASVSRGDGDIYLRIPIKLGTYTEKIWDHAAGALIVQEAGGAISDVRGQPLDFSRGRLLEANQGVIASHADIHPLVVQAVQQAIREEGPERTKALLGE